MAQPNPNAPPPYNPSQSHELLYPDIQSRSASIHGSNLDMISNEISILEDRDLQIEEVKSNFKYLRDKLNKNETRIINRIKDPKPNENTETEDLLNHLANLYSTKSSLEETMKDPLIGATLAESLETIKGQITRLEKQLNIVKYLRWNMSECETAIENLCFVCEGKDILDLHQRKKELLWENVAPGSERTQVNKPVGLTIEPKTDHIFIADSGNKRIQVYNSLGEHLSQIALPDIGNIVFFSFLGEYLFLIGIIPNRRLFLLARMNRISFRTAVTKLTPKNELPISSISSGFLIELIKMKTTLLVSIYLSGHSIWTQFLAIDKFDPVMIGTSRVVKLQSQHIKDRTEAVDLKTVGISQDSVRFLVLYQNSPYALQIFNSIGELVRAIIPLNIYNGLSLFLVDKENNIIICTVYKDTGRRYFEEGLEPESTNLLYSFYVYSETGEKQHQWNYKVSAYKSIFHRLFGIQSKLPMKVSLGVQTEPLREKTTYCTLKENVDHFTNDQVFNASLNSKQELIVMFSSAASSSFLVRAF